MQALNVKELDEPAGQHLRWGSAAEAADGRIADDSSMISALAPDAQP